MLNASWADILNVSYCNFNKTDESNSAITVRRTRMFTEFSESWSGEKHRFDFLDLFTSFFPRFVSASRQDECAYAKWIIADTCIFDFQEYQGGQDNYDHLPWLLTTKSVKWFPFVPPQTCMPVQQDINRRPLLYWLWRKWFTLYFYDGRLRMQWGVWCHR